MRRAAEVIVVAALLSVASATAAGAQDTDTPTGDCPSVVIFTLPGVIWADVERVRPPNLLDLVEQGSLGSMAVRTVSSRTTYSSGFATIGAGTRLDGGDSSGAVIEEGVEAGALRVDVTVGGIDEIRERAEEAGYDARPGALAEALAGRVPVVAVGDPRPGTEPPVPIRRGAWPLLAAMDPEGVVDAAAFEALVADVGSPFGVRADTEALRTAMLDALEDCAVVIVDHGDPTRVDHLSALEGGPLPRQHDAALLAADEFLGFVRTELDPATDLLLVVTPTSPSWDPETHLGVAVAAGPGFAPGSLLRSASTRADGLVTLPDVAPTVLEHLGVDRPDAMLGTPFTDIAADPDGRLPGAVELDREAVYSHGIQADVTTGFVVFQVIVYLAIIVLLRRTEPDGLRRRPALSRGTELGALSVVAFPLASYLSSPLPAHDLTLAALVPVMIAVDIALVGLVLLALRDPLSRLLALTATTFLVMVVDLFFGGRLQFMAVFGNDPINAGRFAGLGNIAFAILGTCSLLTGALMFHRWPARRNVPVIVSLIFGATVIVDGAPQLGSDVGGVLALVPALAITFLLLTGRRPTVKTVLLSAAGAVGALVVFLVVDLSRPPDSQTHLGRFFEDVRARGGGVFLDTIERKARTNLRIITSTIWTYLVPPALALIAYLLLRPRGRARRLALAYPRLRAGLVGALILGAVGFAVNDSGIVVPAMVLSFLVPMSLLIHLSLERGDLVSGGTHER
ncbi:MAG: hypothetical protein M3238_07770 [Actinomycetota bacterium]|nr:hypothetical protein [Actinomycetota bacterium]